MKTIIKTIVLFFIISIVSTVLIKFFDIQYGYVNFWDVHGFLFLIFIAIFPRLTLLFSSVPFGGIFWWLGFFFSPRLLVAVLATVTYWNTNKVLVIISWLFAIGGEGSEKYFIHKHTFGRRNRANKINQNSKIVEAEYYEIKD